MIHHEYKNKYQIMSNHGAHKKLQDTNNVENLESHLFVNGTRYNNIVLNQKNRKTIREINKTIKEAVPIYNAGEHKQCSNMYENLLLAIVKDYPEYRQSVGAAYASINDSERAWAYRRILDSFIVQYEPNKLYSVYERVEIDYKLEDDIGSWGEHYGIIKTPASSEDGNYKEVLLGIIDQNTYDQLVRENIRNVKIYADSRQNIMDKYRFEILS
jgi:hypothetical protein